LVKALLPEEMTITVIQGRGTALYTPLEQYGGDGLHTDLRSDIYAFGCTLYHLLTNNPPQDARQRFLHPDSLVMPRKLNQEISPRTEKAILWAMELHPDDRPSSVNEFIQSLLGTTNFPSAQIHKPEGWNGFLSLIPGRLEKTLLVVCAGILLITLIVSFVP
jgi:eukaryotic-like serine/threonine-protein kinase